jgi:hypothetical protein
MAGAPPKASGKALDLACVMALELLSFRPAGKALCYDTRPGNRID